MTPLRPRLRDALQLRGFSERTQEMAGRAVRPRADSAPKPPDQSTEEALRDACLALQHVTHSSRAARTLAWCGITCCSEQTLTRPWTTLPFVRPPREQQLPVVLRPAEGRTLVAPLPLCRSRAGLTTLSACGLRLQEGPHLQGPAMDSARRLGQVRCGNGAQDRSGPLPPPTLVVRRQSGSTHRPPRWRLPAPGRSGREMATASPPLPRHRVQDAWRAARQARGLPQRASVLTLRPR